MINSYKRKLEKENNFFKLYKFTCTLPKEQSVILSYMIDQEDFITTRLSDDEGFFMCPVEGGILNHLTGWSRKEVDSAIKGLVNGGYIYKRVIRDGIKQITFIKLNHDSLDKLRVQYVTSVGTKGNLVSILSDSRELHNGTFEGINVTTVKNIGKTVGKTMGNIEEETSSNSNKLNEVEEVVGDVNPPSSFNSSSSCAVSTGAPTPTPAPQDAVAEGLIAYMNKVSGYYSFTATKETVSLITNLLNRGYTERDIKQVIIEKYHSWVESGKKFADGTPLSKNYKPSTLFKYDNFLRYKEDAMVYGANLKMANAQSKPSNNIDDYI